MSRFGAVLIPILKHRPPFLCYNSFIANSIAHKVSYRFMIEGDFMTSDAAVLIPRPEESCAAEAARRKIRAALEIEDSMTFSIKGSPDEIEVPPSALTALDRALASIAAGEPFSVVSAREELTTQQAADILNVSRPFLIKLLDSAEIAYRLVGTHRRVDAASLLRFKSADDQKRKAAVDALSAETYELGFV
jgi:excisionase family DNA binding protein